MADAFWKVLIGPTRYVGKWGQQVTGHSSKEGGDFRGFLLSFKDGTTYRFPLAHLEYDHTGKITKST